jgi:hypothetical protein
MIAAIVKSIKFSSSLIILFFRCIRLGRLFDFIPKWQICLNSDKFIVLKMEERNLRPIVKFVAFPSQLKPPIFHPGSLDQGLLMFKI